MKTRAETSDQESPQREPASNRQSPSGVGAQAVATGQRQVKQGERITQLQQQRAGPGANRTGLPDKLKTGIEALSGMDMSGVRVHRNSSKPAALQAHAYAQGSDIHLAPGQEKHLPHEAWHVVQQAQGRVQPTRQLKGGAQVNDSAALESEADAMGSRAASVGEVQASSLPLRRDAPPALDRGVGAAAAQLKAEVAQLGDKNRNNPGRRHRKKLAGQKRGGQHALQEPSPGDPEQTESPSGRSQREETRARAREKERRRQRQHQDHEDRLERAQSNRKEQEQRHEGRGFASRADSLQRRQALKLKGEKMISDLTALPSVTELRADTDLSKAGLGVSRHGRKVPGTFTSFEAWKEAFKQCWTEVQESVPSKVIDESDLRTLTQAPDNETLTQNETELDDLEREYRRHSERVEEFTRMVVQKRSMEPATTGTAATAIARVKKTPCKYPGTGKYRNDPFWPEISAPVHFHYYSRSMDRGHIKVGGHSLKFGPDITASTQNMRQALLLLAADQTALGTKYAEYVHRVNEQI